MDVLGLLEERAEERLVHHTLDQGKHAMERQLARSHVEEVDNWDLDRVYNPVIAHAPRRLADVDLAEDRAVGHRRAVGRAQHFSNADKQYERAQKLMHVQRLV